METSLRDRLLRVGRRAGLDAVGVASAEPFDEVREVLHRRKSGGLHGGMAFTYRNPDRSTDPAREVPGARSIIVGARGYRRRAPASRPPEPMGAVARYSWEDHYEPVRAALGAVAVVLRDAGWEARVLVDDNALVDRAAAHRAGLGWYGKNTNLLLPGHGSWFVLGSVVTDAPLEPTADEPLPHGSGCGACDRCLPACPTGALVAPGVLDARRCLAWLLEAPGAFPREHREALGNRVYGCDDCQEACPPNRLEDRRTPAAPASPDAEPWVDLLAMLAMSDRELLVHFGRWYIARRDASHLRRNVLLALGNVGDGSDERTAAALAAALRDERVVVRSTAVWAAFRLGRGDLVDDAGLRRDPSPLVRDEIGEPAAPRTA